MLPVGITRDMLIEMAVRSLNALSKSDSPFEIKWAMKIADVYIDQLREFLYEESFELETQPNKE